MTPGPWLLVAGVGLFAGILAAGRARWVWLGSTLLGVSAVLGGLWAL